MDLNLGASPVAVDVIYRNIKYRHGGIIKALTSDVERFYNQCDPEKETMCLFGLPDGSWRVGRPEREVPPDLPEPALGINFARDDMSRDEWLTLIALHSDAWLLSLASFYAAELTRSERKQLLMMLSDLPTAYDIVTGKETDENISSVDQINYGSYSGEGNQDDGDDSSSHLIHMPVPEGTIAEKTIAATNAAITAGSGKKELFDGATVEETVPNPRMLLKKGEQMLQAISLRGEKQQHSTQNMTRTSNSDSPRCRELAFSRIETDPPSTQENEGQLPRKNHDFCKTGLSGHGQLHERALNVRIRRPGSQTPTPSETKKQAEATPTQRSLPHMDETEEHLLADEYTLEEEDDDDDLICDICQGHDSGNDESIFWISCDSCKKWFHGKCVKITAARAEYMKHFKCPVCTRNKAPLYFL